MTTEVVSMLPEGANSLDGGQNAVPGPSRHRFQPVRHLYEPPRPPPLDQKVEEEAAAQAAAQAAGYEGRKMRRFLQRRTVDYLGSWVRYRDRRIARSTYRDDYWLKPSPHQVVSLMPPVADRSPAASAAPNLVHTSTNKIRTPVNCVSWLPSSRRLLTGSSSGEFTLWNGMTFNFETILQACDNGVRNLEWSSSGGLLLSGDAGGTVKYFLPNMNNVLAIEAHRESIRGISFSPGDTRWISGSDDSTIKMFNTERGVEEATFKGHGWDVKCVQWHPFKGLIASGGKDNLVKFWDPRRGGREIGTFHGHKNTIQALSFSPSHVSSSELLATASRDQTIKLYDLRMVREYLTLRPAPLDEGAGEPGGVCSLSWHPFSPLLSSGLSTGTLQHHSLAPSLTPDLPISSISDAHDQSIWAMAWHPLGQILATGGNDCFTRWWERDRPEHGDFTKVTTEQTGAAADGVPTNGGTGGFNDRQRGRSAWAEDDDDGMDTGFHGIIPGLGGARAPVPAPPSSSSSMPAFRSDRPPPPPGFGFNVEEGMGGQQRTAGHPRNPAATGANVGRDGRPIQDAGWGRGSGPDVIYGNDAMTSPQNSQMYGANTGGASIPGLGSGGPLPGFGMSSNYGSYEQPRAQWNQQPPSRPPGY